MSVRWNMGNLGNTCKQMKVSEPLNTMENARLNETLKANKTLKQIRRRLLRRLTILFSAVLINAGIMFCSVLVDARPLRP